MTIFSSILSEHIKSKSIRTYPLAQYCGVDRSNMYKLISGKRNPNSEELVQKMADFMRLTPTERREMLEAYEVTIVGYETYYRRKNVQDFISNFSIKRESNPDINGYFTTVFDYSYFTDRLTVSGRAKLNHAIYGILAQEAQKEHGHIKLLLQPESEDFMEILEAISKDRPNLKIDHIICLNNTDDITSDKRDYNLSCLQKIIPMYCTCFCEYTPLCYYDNINSHNSKFNLLSSLIITSEYAMAFSPQLQYGILFAMKNTLRKFHEIFEDLKLDATPVVCKIDSIFTQFDYFSSLKIGERMGFSFQQEPCLIPMLPLSFPEKYLVRDLPDRETFVLSARQYIQQKSDALKIHKNYFYFTENGIRSFLKTGRFYELPDSIYNPVDHGDRIMIMRALMSACENQRYKMLRPDAPIASSHLCIYVTAHNGYLMFTSPDGNLVYLNLEEPSLLLAFYDYLSSLDERLFYSVEETLAILKDLLKSTK